MVDYRLPEHRRETFFKFYEYHLEHKAHAGAVYYAMPYIFKEMLMNQEEILWFIFINGNTQNVCTTYQIWKEFPRLDDINIEVLKEWYADHRKGLPWDTDRRYTRTSFVASVASYLNALKGRNQQQYFNDLCTGDEHENFRTVWDAVINNFETFGRLSTFSYLEYLRIGGLPIDCDQLFLEDIAGSKSHRNGLCKVLGRDDLDWWKQPKVDYSSHIPWLKEEADELLAEAKRRIDHPDVNFFTLETTLCCYKGWHRINRRYPNVYNDMFHDRIKKAESLNPQEDYSIFWAARKEALPKRLRLEDNPLDKGLCKEKQNHYRLTGEPIMMEDKGFIPSERPWVRNCVLLMGACGVGKTWVMRSLLTADAKPFKLGKFCWHETDTLIVVGKYDGSMFQGSDKLSMSVMTDLAMMLKYIKRSGKLAVFEGDRFTNRPFIEKADPYIIKIEGTGEEGRKQRGSTQSERQIKSISTRVSNLTSHRDVSNSNMALNTLKLLQCEHLN